MASDSPWQRMTKDEQDAWIQAKAAEVGAKLDAIDADHPRPGEPSLRSLLAEGAREARREDGSGREQ